jgi:hypothetical protein
LRWIRYRPLYIAVILSNEQSRDEGCAAAAGATFARFFAGNRIVHLGVCDAVAPDRGAELHLNPFLRVSANCVKVMEVKGGAFDGEEPSILQTRLQLAI